MARINISIYNSYLGTLAANGVPLLYGETYVTASIGDIVSFELTIADALKNRLVFYSLDGTVLNPTQDFTYSNPIRFSIPVTSEQHLLYMSLDAILWNINTTITGSGNIICDGQNIATDDNRDVVITPSANNIRIDKLIFDKGTSTEYEKGPYALGEVANIKYDQIKRNYSIDAQFRQLPLVEKIYVDGTEIVIAANKNLELSEGNTVELVGKGFLNPDTTQPSLVTLRLHTTDGDFLFLQNEPQGLKYTDTKITFVVPSYSTYTTIGGNLYFDFNFVTIIDSMKWFVQPLTSNESFRTLLKSSDFINPLFSHDNSKIPYNEYYKEQSRYIVVNSFSQGAAGEDWYSENVYLLEINRNIESKKIKFSIDTTNLFAISEEKARLLGISKLTPFVSSSMFTVRSIPKIGGTNILDNAVTCSINNDPESTRFEYEFSPQRDYTIQLETKVLYYDNDGNQFQYTDASGDLITFDRFVRTINLKFKQNGIPSLVPMIGIDKKSIDFGVITVGTSSKVDITIKNDGYATLKVSSIYSGSSEFSMIPSTFEVKSGNYQEAKITYTPITEDKIDDILYINHNINDTPAQIKTFGKGIILIPKIVANTATLDFGNTYSSSALFLTLINTGSAVASVTSITTTSTIFKVDTSISEINLSSIAPSESSNIRVTFKPDAVDSFNDELTVNYNGIPYIVTLRGNGIEMPPSQSQVNNNTSGSGSYFSNPSSSLQPPPNYITQDTSLRKKVCSTCIFATAGICTKYQFNFDFGKVCDSWQVNGICQEYLYSNGEYILNTEPYFGYYHLWAPDTNTAYSAYTGKYFGEIARELLIKNDGKIKLLLPNFNNTLEVKSSQASSSMLSINSIVTGSLLTEVNSKKADYSKIQLNIDYSEFSNFILFSSAYDRIINFRSKIDFIEEYNRQVSNIESLGTITNSQLSQSLQDIKNKKKDLVNGLTTFEKYLYFESSSIYSGNLQPYPKMNTSKPYTLYSVTSSLAVNYFNVMLQSASIFDENNFGSLSNTLPVYFKEESVEQFGGYLRMVKMYGELFDELYLYAKDIANREIDSIAEKTNVSPDLLPYLLDYFKLFNKSKKSDADIINYLLQNDSYLEGSSQDYVNEVYYRILQSAPYIAKARGTKKSVKAILNAMGIPEDYLQIKEYGRTQGNFDDDIDEVRIRKDVVKQYYLDFKGEQTVRVNWVTSSITTSVPNVIQLKFKSNHNSGLYTKHVLLEGTSSAGSWAIVLQNSGSTYDEASAVVKFVLNGAVSCSTPILPIFNDIPWTLYFYRDTNLYSVPTQSYFLNASQFKFDNINFSGNAQLVVSSSVINSTYSSTGSLYLGGSSTSSISPSSHGNPYYGEMTEFRLWSTELTDEINDNFIKSPSFYGGTNITSSFTDLVTWLKLNEDINHYTTSSVNDYNLTGAKNHGTASNFENAIDDSNYLNYYEEEQYELQNFDTQTYSDEKIYIVSSSLSSTALSPLRRVEKTSEELYGVESNKLTIDMSTSTLVNRDLFRSYDFELDNFIGDPRYQTLDTYDNLDIFRIGYLKKYPSSNVDAYSVFDQASSYDHSVFELVKNIVPFKADFQMGFRVEQTALERSKNKGKVSSGTYGKYEANLRYEDGAPTASYNNYNIVIDEQFVELQNSVANLSTFSFIDIKDGMLILSRSTVNLSNGTEIQMLPDDRILFKTDRYNTPANNVPGFGTYMMQTIHPTSDFSLAYTKSGSIFTQAFDSALDVHWTVGSGGILDLKYSSDHIIYHRDDIYKRRLMDGTIQSTLCELDGKSIIEIVKTTAQTPMVYDKENGDSILRV